MNLLLLLISLLSFSTHARVDHRDTLEVFQREYIYTNSSINENIQTIGVFTCVALVMLDEDGNGALAHFDASTDLKKGMSELVSSFDEASELRVSLYGGQSPYRLERKIVEELETYGLRAARIERNMKPNDSMNINVNLKTGVISQYEEITSKTSYKERAFKADRMKFSKRLYRHQRSIGGGDYVPEFSRDEDRLFIFPQ